MVEHTGKRLDVRHAAAQLQALEHGLVVGGIAEEQHLLPDGAVVLPQHLPHKEAGHVQLVVIPVPGVDMDGADLGHL